MNYRGNKYTLIGGWLLLVFLLVACEPQPLPTRRALAAFPPTSTPVPTKELPPTSTPVPTPTLLPSPTPCASTGEVVQGVLTSQLAGTVPYRVYLPPCYGQDGRSYPTLYMLPGNIHTDSIWDDLGLDETAETIIRQNQIPPLLIVMASGGYLANYTSGGPGSYEEHILNELIPFIEATYCAWPTAAGRALGGLSRGGYWALEIAFRHPDQFRSVGGHSASLLDIAAGPDLNPQYTALTHNLGNLRIYLDIGDRDPAIANTLRLHQDMIAAQIPHEWQLNPGGHDNAYWSAHLEEYLRWYTAPWPLTRPSYPPCSPK